MHGVGLRHVEGSSQWQPRCRAQCGFGSFTAAGKCPSSLSAGLTLLAVQAALVFVCPNAGETVKSVVQERFKRFARVMGSDKRRLHLEPRVSAPCHRTRFPELRTSRQPGGRVQMLSHDCSVAGH